MSCEKCLVLCVVLCYVHIKRSESQRVPTDDTPIGRKRYRAYDEALPPRRNLRGRQGRPEDYHYGPPNARRPNYYDYEADYRERYRQGPWRNRRPFGSPEVDYRQEQRRPPFRRNNGPPFARDYGAYFEGDGMSYRKENMQAIDENNFQTHDRDSIHKPNEREQIHKPHGKENIQSYARDNIQSHHKEQVGTFARNQVDREKTNLEKTDKRDKSKVEKENVRLFERENEELPFVRKERRPVARSDKFRMDTQDEPQIVERRVDPLDRDGLRGPDEYPNDFRAHRRRQPFRDYYDSIAPKRQKHFYDYEYYRNKGPYRPRDYDNRPRYYDRGDYYQPGPYERRPVAQRSQNFYHWKQNKFDPTENEREKGKHEQENKEILKKIMENHIKDNIAEQEEGNKPTVSTTVKLKHDREDIVKTVLNQMNNNINPEPVTQKSDGSTIQKSDRQKKKISVVQNFTLMRSEIKGNLTEKTDTKNHDITKVVTRRNEEYKGHVTTTIHVEQHETVDTNDDWGNFNIIDKYNQIVDKCDKQFESFMKQYQVTQKSIYIDNIINKGNTKPTQRDLSTILTTKKWFWTGKEIKKAKPFDSSQEITVERKDSKSDAYDSYVEKKFAEMPPGHNMKNHFAFKHLRPDCVTEYTHRMPKKFSVRDSQIVSDESKLLNKIFAPGNKDPRELNHPDMQDAGAESKYLVNSVSSEIESKKDNEPDSKGSKNRHLDFHEHPQNKDDSAEVQYTNEDEEMMYDPDEKSDNSDKQLDQLLNRVDKMDPDKNHFSGDDVSNQARMIASVSKQRKSKKKRKKESLPYYTSAEWEEKRHNRGRRRRSLRQNLTVHIKEREKIRETTERKKTNSEEVRYDEMNEMYHNPKIIEEDLKDYSTLYRKDLSFENSGEKRYYQRFNRFMRRHGEDDFKNEGKRNDRKRRSLTKAKRDIMGMLQKTTIRKDSQSSGQDSSDSIPEDFRRNADFNKMNEIIDQNFRVVSATTKKLTFTLRRTTEATTVTSTPTPDLLAMFYKAFSHISPTTGSTDISSYFRDGDIQGNFPASNASDIDHSYYDVLQERIRNLKKGGDGRLKRGQTIRRSRPRGPDSFPVPDEYLAKHGHRVNSAGKVVNITTRRTTERPHHKYDEAIAIMKKKRDMRRNQFVKRYKDPNVFYEDTDEWLAGHTRRTPAILTRGYYEVTKSHRTEPLIIQDIDKAFDTTNDQNSLKDKLVDATDSTTMRAEFAVSKSSTRKRNIEKFERDLNVYTYEFIGQPVTKRMGESNTIVPRYRRNVLDKSVVRSVDTNKYNNRECNISGHRHRRNIMDKSIVDFVCKSIHATNNPVYHLPKCRGRRNIETQPVIKSVNRLKQDGVICGSTPPSRNRMAIDQTLATRRYFHRVEEAGHDTDESQDGQDYSQSIQESQLDHMEALLHKYNMKQGNKEATPEIRVCQNISSPDPSKWKLKGDMNRQKRDHKLESELTFPRLKQYAISRSKTTKILQNIN